MGKIDISQIATNKANEIKDFYNLSTSKRDVIKNKICEWAENMSSSSNWHVGKEYDIQKATEEAEKKVKEITAGKEKPTMGLETPEIKEARKDLEIAKETAASNNLDAKENLDTTTKKTETNNNQAKEEENAVRESAGEKFSEAEEQVNETKQTAEANNEAAEETVQETKENAENNNKYAEEQVNETKQTAEANNKAAEEQTTAAKENKEKASENVNVTEESVEEAESKVAEAKASSNNTDSGEETSSNTNNTAVETAEANLQEAKEQLKEAKEEEQDAEEILNVTEENAEQVKAEGEQTVADAEKNTEQVNAEGEQAVADAEKNTEQIKAEGEQAVADAEENAEQVKAEGEQAVADAEKNTEQVKTEGEQAVTDAKEDVKETKENGENAVENAENNLNETSEAEKEKIENIQKELIDIRYNKDSNLNTEQKIHELVKEITPENVNRIFSDRNALAGVIQERGSKEDFQKVLNVMGESVNNMESMRAQYPNITDEGLDNKIQEAKEVYNNVLNDQDSSWMTGINISELAQLNSQLEDNLETMKQSVNINGDMDFVANQKVGNCWAHGGFESLATIEEGRKIIKDNISRDPSTGITTVYLPEAGKSYQVTDQELYEAKLSKGDADMTAYMTAIEKYFDENKDYRPQTLKDRSDRYNMEGNTTARLYEIMTGTKGEKIKNGDNIPQGISSILWSENEKITKEQTDKIYDSILGGNMAVNIGAGRHAWSVAGVSESGNLLIRESNQSKSYITQLAGDKSKVIEHKKAGGTMEYFAEVSKERFYEILTGVTDISFYRA